LAEREREFLEPYSELLESTQHENDLSGMIRIPAGLFLAGTYERDDFRFEYHDFIPAQVVDLPEFFIDALPVTNVAYCTFAKAITLTNHRTCHPDEPPNKDHWPSHLRDPRFAADDMPVTGIDWYDAYLLTWGNNWEAGTANHVEMAFGERVEDLHSWENLLRRVDAHFPAEPLWRVGLRRRADSFYGVSDMSGNVWEWTRTNFYTNQDMDPFFRGRDVLAFTNRPAAFPVIRGGCWTSLPEMLRTFFRGKDLLTDRHFEIGFRCVWENYAQTSP
jgi:iron(II)-dependent oxidoreductase